MKYDLTDPNRWGLPKIELSEPFDVEVICVLCGLRPDDHDPDLCPSFRYRVQRIDQP